MKTVYSHGKLLLTSEYAVLKSAKALAVPCKMGQSLMYTPSEDGKLYWQSFDTKKCIWFEAVFTIHSLELISSSDAEVASRLQTLLKTSKKMNPTFLTQGGEVKCHLEFDRSWGLGSSSTLVANIAQWAETNPYELLAHSFGGSGYDIACALAQSPITYRRNQNNPKIEAVELSYPFEDNLFFVHLNKKRNSQEAVAAFDFEKVDQSYIDSLSQLTDQIISCPEQTRFNDYLKTHERLVGELLHQTSVQDMFFPDFKGAIKSLGAWGGDFVWVSGTRQSPEYFRQKGYKTILSFREMLL